jgi:hypothetical protein
MVLDSAGKSFVRGLFGIPDERQESQQSGGFNNDKPPSQTTPLPSSSPSPSPSSSPTTPTNPSIPTQPSSQSPPLQCIANGNSVERIDRNSPASSISIGGRTVRVSSRVNLMSGSSYEIICKILRHPASEKVRFGIAIADNSNLNRALVGVSLAGQNGVKRQGKAVFAGQARLMTINTSGVESFSIVLRPLNGDGYIYPIAVPQLP